MDPSQPSSSRCGDAHQRENTPDPLAEFLAQLLTDIPPVLPTSLATPPPPPPPPSPSVTVSGPIPTPITVPVPVPVPTPIPVPAVASTSASTSAPTPNPPITCQWTSPNGPPIITCGTPLSHNPKDTCAHFRRVHHVRGNERVIVVCHWRDCDAAPMQRGSLIRHILSVHLGLLRWRCGVCRRVFSRRGTSHVCAEGG